MKCPRCGYDNSDELEFCSICGLSLKPNLFPNSLSKEILGNKLSTANSKTDGLGSHQDADTLSLNIERRRELRIESLGSLADSCPSAVDNQIISESIDSEIQVERRAEHKGDSPSFSSTFLSDEVSDLVAESREKPIDRAGEGEKIIDVSVGTDQMNKFFKSLLFPPKELLIRPLEVEVPSLWRRLLAGILDLIPLSLFAAAVIVLFGPRADGPVPSMHPIDLLFTGISSFRVHIVLFIIFTAAIYGIYSAVIVGLTGSSIGKRFMGMEIASISGSSVGWSEAVARAVAFSIFGLLFLLSPLSILLSPSGRGIHDLVSGTIVIKSK